MVKKETKVSGQALVAADAKKPVRSRMHSVDVDAVDFFTLLNNHIEPEVGKCPEGFKREIAWQSVPESGVVTILVTDTPEEIPVEETVQ